MWPDCFQITYNLTQNVSMTICNLALKTGKYYNIKKFNVCNLQTFCHWLDNQSHTNTVITVSIALTSCDLRLNTQSQQTEDLARMRNTISEAHTHFYTSLSYSRRKKSIHRFPLSHGCWQERVRWKSKEGEKNGKSSWNHGTLYAGDPSRVDFWVSQVMGEIVSAVQLINSSAGSIYLCLRQSFWEMGTVKWESTACFSSPQLPSGHFIPQPSARKAACEEKLINIKQVESGLLLPSPQFLGSF